ncbi:ribokinase [Enterococcus sp. HY326]|uniref:ribokinase n=1 Tax=Enterococcus sp. HY326 TaxID=2971265 RepID=UPI002240BD5F|nr:ribokinase [Enterococcus sp. HY326]
MNKVTVLGSINLDTTIRMKQLPKPGETVHSKELFSSGGGKGANQGIAAQRSGAMTTFIGAVGNDEAGKLLLDLLSQDGIDISGIRTLENERTGSAVVMVDDVGENCIVIHSGANEKVSLPNSNWLIHQIQNSDFLIAQFETNLNVIIQAFKIAKENGIKTILNPAPGTNRIPRELLQNTDILIPNETEVEIITGLTVQTEENLETAAKEILKYGVEVVIITLGSRGSYYFSQNGSGIIAAQKVQAIDSTAAGDTFIGALAAVLKADYSNLVSSIEFASHASAITVQRYGAQPSIPYLKEILATK